MKGRLTIVGFVFLFLHSFTAAVIIIIIIIICRGQT